MKHETWISFILFLAFFSTPLFAKDCYKCQKSNEVMYRCRYEELQAWVFLCGKCLQQVKTANENTYQYGGTWKAKKK